MLRLFAVAVALLIAGTAEAQSAAVTLPDGRECLPPPERITPTDAPIRVDLIEIRGLHRTRQEVVLRELPFAAGDNVDAQLWSFALTRLWNCTLFDQVDGHLERDLATGQVRVVIELGETWTLNPLFSFAFGGSAGWARVGASDNNIAGRFLELGAQYERFNEHNGFQFWARDPRFLGKRLDWVVLVERLVRPRPLFADRRLRISSEVFGLFRSDRVKVSGRLEGLYDVLLPVDGGPDNDAPRNWSMLVEGAVRLGRLDTVRLRTSGASLEVRSTYVATRLATLGGHAQGWVEGLAHVMLGERWNLSTRVQLGMQGNAPDYQRFWLGGLQHIRGYVDNYARTDRFALINAEARWIAFDSKWFALMAAAFVDAAVTHDTERGTRAMVSTGIGGRGLLPWMVRTGMRVDLALPLVDGPCKSGAALCPGLSVGVYQFF